MSARLMRRCLCLFALCLSVWTGTASAACQPAAPTSLPAAAGKELLIATQNLWLLHDAEKNFRYDKPVPKAQVKARIEALARYVITRLSSPHLLALQEVESQQLLDELVAAIRVQGGPDYQVHFLPKRDVAGNAVALLSRAPVEVGQVHSLFAGLVVPGNKRADLFSRLPLLVTIKQPLAMQLLVVHLRSAHGLTDKRKRSYVLAKRRGQTQALIRWARQQQSDYLVLGDFNSAKGRGDFAAPWQRLIRAGWQEAQSDTAADNYSYRYRCKAQQLDHIFLSQDLWPHLKHTAYAHGNAGSYRKMYASHGIQVVSDHDAIGVYLSYP